MYEELIKSLKICGTPRLLGENCIAFHDGCCEAEPICMYELMMQAADAIEELQKKYLASELDAINLTGWLAEEHAKHLWIPVTERLPLYGQDVLAVRTYGDGEKCQEVLMAHISVWNEGTGEKWWNVKNITHWMPRPEPPKEET